MVLWIALLVGVLGMVVLVTNLAVDEEFCFERHVDWFERCLIWILSCSTLILRVVTITSFMNYIGRMNSVSSSRWKPSYCRGPRAVIWDPARRMTKVGECRSDSLTGHCQRNIFVGISEASRLVCVHCSVSKT